MKEALFYEGKENKKVRCRLCHHNCLIDEGDFGVCGVRKNKEGELYSLVYGRPISISVDPIEKKPLYHFNPGKKILSIGTFGCNLRCRFCQNFDISQVKEKTNFEEMNNNLEFFSPEKIVKVCIEKGLDMIAFTYTEPTIFYEYMLDIARLAKKEGIKTVAISNGHINPEPLKKLLPYMDAFNIDLKAFNQAFYKDICGGSLGIVKNTIKEIVNEGKHLEITMLVIKDHNDEEKEFESMCKWISSLDESVVLHLSRAFPYYKMNFEVTPVELLKKLKKIADRYLDSVYLGNV